MAVERGPGGKWIGSGNPGGRPKAPIRLRELYDAKGGDDKLFNRLWELVDDFDGRIAIAAMDRLLERRYGKVQIVDQDGNAIADPAVKQLQMRKLEAEIKVLELRATEGDPEKIDADAEMRRLDDLRARYPELLAVPGQDA